VVDWAAVEHDLDVVRYTRANLLLIGPDGPVTAIVRRVVAGSTATVVNPADVVRLPLSHLWAPSGLLVVRDVHTFDANGQALLSDWLSTGSGERQVVSTAATCLLPLVAAGLFDGRLYYRLNTISIRLSL
jgi:hypothetical protein